jgi:hypothetical protein
MSIAEWEAKVYDFASNLTIGRGLYEADRDRGGDGFRPWAANTSGNFRRSYRVAKHWAGNVDVAWYVNPEITFRWWDQKWIPGDLPVWEMERSRRALGERWQTRWAAKHPKQMAILQDGTLGLVEAVDGDVGAEDETVSDVCVTPFSGFEIDDVEPVVLELV